MKGFAQLWQDLVGAWSALTSLPVTEVVSWFLAGVFLWSAIPKLRRPAVAAMAMVDLGLLRRSSVPAGLGVGLLELALSAALFLDGPNRWPRVIAACLLGSLAALMAAGVVTDRRQPCYCFGDAHEPLSWFSVLRTGLLATIATVLSLGAVGAPSFALLPAVSRLTGAAALLGSFALVVELPDLLSWNSEVRQQLRWHRPLIPEVRVP